MTTSLEREYQNKLDKLARVDEESFVCDSCEIELVLEQQCDHDPKTVHHWGIDCCVEFAELNSIEWDDLD